MKLETKKEKKRFPPRKVNSHPLQKEVNFNLAYPEETREKKKVNVEKEEIKGV